MNPQSLNRYAYVDNNPASFNDPTGLSHFLVYAPACPEGDFACGCGMDGGSGGFDTNPGDPCAYVSSSDGQGACQLPPGLWNNGEPIFLPYPGGYGGGGGGSIGGGGTAASAPPAGQPPLGGSEDFLGLPPCVDENALGSVIAALLDAALHPVTPIKVTYTGTQGGPLISR